MSPVKPRKRPDNILIKANSGRDRAEFRVRSRTDRIRSEPIPQLIIGPIYLLIITRFIWPLQLPLAIKIVAALLVLIAVQFHRWSKLSSGSIFSPEFPRPVVALFNWAIGAVVLLARARRAA